MSRVLLLCAALVAFEAAGADAGPLGGRKKATRYGPQPRPATETTARFDVNNIAMTMKNSGQVVFPGAAAGMEWPKDSGSSVVYAGGLWIAGRVNENLRIAAVQYDTSGFQPGTMRAGVPASPADTLFRFYTIGRADTPGVPDYDRWPVLQGAPASGGAPLRKGEQNVWCVYNDGRITGREFYTQPLHVEVQQYVYGDTLAGALNNTVFVEYSILNRDSAAINSMFISLWLDTDVGDFNDDAAGVDTGGGFAYCYNGKAVDAVFGSTPPAVGLLVLRSPSGPYPAAVPHSFVTYHPQLTFPVTAQEAYNYLRGFNRDGSEIIDPSTAAPTSFMYGGDPADTSGWVDTTAADKVLLLSFGPFSLLAGDSTVFHAAIIVARGTDRLNSISELRQAVPVVRAHYDAKLVGVSGGTRALPAALFLSQNFPNPFNPSTTIEYSLPRSEYVRLLLYDLAGRLVATIVDGVQEAGDKRVEIRAGSLATGDYFCRLQAGTRSQTRKMLLVR